LESGRHGKEARARRALIAGEKEGMIIVLGTAGFLLFVTFADSVIRYARVEKRDPVPLTDQERMHCCRIIDAGTGLPWICRKAVETGECPCLPCEMLERERLKETSRHRSPPL
jgi:hypothetical protein